MIWKPHTTVAAIVEHQGKFLLVEEDTADGIHLNQPAGHLEEGESLLDAVIRETREESAYLFKPERLLGIYHWQHPDKDITYIRFAYIGGVSDHKPEQPLDTGILRAVWLTLDEIRSSQPQHRSPQVLKCIEDYVAGQSFPLNVVSHL